MKTCVISDKQLHNNLFKGVIKFIIQKSDSNSEISIFIDKITQDGETYVNYRFAFGAENLSYTDFEYVFTSDPNKIKKIEDLHNVLNQHGVELAMFDIFIAILGGQVLNLGPQSSPYYQLGLSLKLDEHEDSRVAGNQPKFYENTAEIDLYSISWN